MASFFSGWIGYGTGLQAGVMQEPGDTAYTRRPIEFSILENGMTFDLDSGTVGPSSVSWGTLTLGGLFDAASGGNLLVFFPLMTPVPIGSGMTYTTSPGVNILVGGSLRSVSHTQALPAASAIGVTPDGRAWTANLPLQIVQGVLSAQSLTFGATVTMGTLPSMTPSSGSGQLWNDGGIVAVA